MAKPVRTLTVQSPVSLNQPFQIMGAGFSKGKKGQMAYVGVKYYAGLTPVAADNVGNFSFPHPGLSSAFLYTAVAMVFEKRDWKVVAEAEFQVV